MSQFTFENTRLFIMLSAKRGEGAHVKITNVCENKLKQSLYQIYWLNGRNRLNAPYLQQRVENKKHISNPIITEG